MDKRRQLASETGLYTFDVFEVLLNYEIARISRHPSPLTLMHIALATENQMPEFKKQALEAMTNLLSRALRVSDVPTHYNEDFLVLMPATDGAGGIAVADRILGNYRTTKSLATGRLSPRRNAYIGITTHQGNEIHSAQQLMAEASVAMNEARLRHSFTLVSYTEIAHTQPKPP
jgi:GGDEF domain-containing protein